MPNDPITDTWQQLPSGLFVPVPAPALPEPEPDVTFRPPRPDERHAGILCNTFEGYLRAMDGRPCSECGGPVSQGWRHETACEFSCACGWRAGVNADGKMTVRDRESGIKVTIELR